MLSSSEASSSQRGLGMRLGSGRFQGPFEAEGGPRAPQALSSAMRAHTSQLFTSNRTTSISYSSSARGTTANVEGSTRRRENNELFLEYDEWSTRIVDTHIHSNPTVRALTAGLVRLVSWLRSIGTTYLNAHSPLVHMISFFCFLSGAIGIFIAYAMDCNIAAFTIPAVHHKWNLREKADGCRNAAFYYFISGFASIFASWLGRTSFFSRWNVPGLRANVPAPHQQRQQRNRAAALRRQRDASNETDDDSSESELRPIIDSIPSGLQSRSGGYTSGSGGYASGTGRVGGASPNSSPRTELAVGASGRIPPNSLRLVGLAEDSEGNF